MLHRVVLLAATAGLLAVAPARAEEEHHRSRSRQQKEVFRDGDCVVKREWKKHGDYREERRCKGDREARRPVHVFPARAVRPQPAQ